MWLSSICLFHDSRNISAALLYLFWYMLISIFPLFWYKFFKNSLLIGCIKSFYLISGVSSFSFCLYFHGIMFNICSKSYAAKYFIRYLACGHIGVCTLHWLHCILYTRLSYMVIGIKFNIYSNYIVNLRSYLHQ